LSESSRGSKSTRRRPIVRKLKTKTINRELRTKTSCQITQGEDQSSESSRRKLVVRELKMKTRRTKAQEEIESSESSRRRLVVKKLRMKTSRQRNTSPLYNNLPMCVCVEGGGDGGLDVNSVWVTVYLVSSVVHDNPIVSL
jgi:hypothetical protein